MGLMVKHGLYPPQIPADRQMCWEHCPQSDPDTRYLHPAQEKLETRIQESLFSIGIVSLLNSP